MSMSLSGNLFTSRFILIQHLWQTKEAIILFKVWIWVFVYIMVPLTLNFHRTQKMPSIENHCKSTDYDSYKT